MLAIITHNGVSLVNTTSLKDPSSSFPISNSLECSSSAWSVDNSDLYLANSSSIKRYTPSECLLEELYHGSDAVTCVETKDKSSILFFAAANKVWSLDCAYSPGRLLSCLEPHKSDITRISVSHDGNLLASVSASAVFVHNLALASHAQLRGLPDRKSVACCLFHQHSRRLLLGAGRDFVVYDPTRPSGPLKTVRIPGGGEIVGMTSSPFSKTLVAAVTSNGGVVLVDLNKDNGILKAVNVKTPLTCCAFTTEGAAIYLGTECGNLLILDLRSLEKEPKSFTIGDGDAPIKAINVQAKSKSHVTNTASTKSATIVKSSPRRSVSSARTSSSGSVVAGSGDKSPIRAPVSPGIRGGGGVTPKKKLFTLVRSPLLETKNSAVSRSPAQSCRTKPLRFHKGDEHEENIESADLLSFPAVRGPIDTTNARQRPKSNSSQKTGQDIERLGLGSAPESISGHLAAIRVGSGPTSKKNLRNEGDHPKTARRVNSGFTETTSTTRKHKNGSPVPAQSKASSSKSIHEAVHLKKSHEQWSTTPDDDEDRLELSSPELPREPVTPISLGKNLTMAPLASATGTGVLGPTSLEDQKGKAKGKQKVVETKKTRFAQNLNAEESSAGSSTLEDGGAPKCLGDRRREEREEELSLQVSPCRQTAFPPWLRSPHRPSGSNMNMNTAAQDFLRNIVHEVMYDFQRETKAEVMGLHLDLVRMGRGWKQELRGIMEEWSEEIRELKAENKRLKEENERLRRM